MYVPGVGWASASVRLAADVRVLVLVADIESKVVHNVSGIFDDVGSLLHITDCGVAAEVLEGSHVVGVGGGGQARENSELGEEEGSGADGQKGTLSGRVVLLELGKCSDDGHGLGLALQNAIAVTANDNEDIELLQALVGFLEGDLGVNYDALVGDNLGLGTSNGAVKGSGS